MSFLFDILVALAGIRWVWAALVMAAFVAVTIITMLLARYPVRRAPPPPVTPPAAGEHDQPPRTEG